MKEDKMKQRAEEFFSEMKTRRSIRKFSNQPVSREIIDLCLKAAGRSPSGANQQPWHFVVISNDKMKKKIRKHAEREEKKFYTSRAPEEMLNALESLNTNWKKPFLENAPYLIVIFAKNAHYNENGEKIKHYYVSRSVGIATGILITALHYAGLSVLPYTPSSMMFLKDLLDRPETEWPFLLLVVGHQHEDAEIPPIRKKSLEEITSYIE